MTQYWGGTKQFFLLILFNFKNIGGHVPPLPPPPPPSLLRGPCSYTFKVTVQFDTEGNGQNEIVYNMDRSEVKL